MRFVALCDGDGGGANIFDLAAHKNWPASKGTSTFILSEPYVVYRTQDNELPRSQASLLGYLLLA
jgi:hypothetical protein